MSLFRREECCPRFGESNPRCRRSRHRSRGARLENPSSSVARLTIRFGEQRDALFSVRKTAEAPLGFHNLNGRARKWRREGKDLVAERHFVFQITAVECLRPRDRRRLIQPPANGAWSRFHAV